MRLSAEIISQSEQRSNALGEREIVLRGLAIPAIEHLATTRDLFETIDLTDNRLVRLDNFPRLNRLSSILLSGNSIESIDGQNLEKNVPNLINLDLSHNRINGLHEVANISSGCPKLEHLTLIGNPVTSEYNERDLSASPLCNIVKPDPTSHFLYRTSILSSVYHKQNTITQSPRFY